MSFLETIGFVISFLAFIILSIKKSLEDRQRHSQGEDSLDDFEDEEMERIERHRAFLRDVNMDMEDSAPSPPQSKHPKEKPKQKPKPVLQQQFKPPARKAESFTSSLEEHRLAVNLDSHKLDVNYDRHHKPHLHRDAYSLVRNRASNKGLRAISNLQSIKEMVILKEIISPPISIRNRNDNS